MTKQSTQYIAVGSKNPTKLDAVLAAFKKVFPKISWEVTGVEVASGVADQPMSDKEAIEGATNRAKQALIAVPAAAYAVGLEGGLHQIGNRWFDSGWIVVVNRSGILGIASSIRMYTPKKIMKPIHTGQELGTVIDQIFGQTNSKHELGHFGLMTQGRYTRTEAYRDGVISALTRFLPPGLELGD